MDEVLSVLGPILGAAAGRTLASLAVAARQRRGGTLSATDAQCTCRRCVYIAFETCCIKANDAHQALVERRDAERRKRWVAAMAATDSVLEAVLAEGPDDVAVAAEKLVMALAEAPVPGAESRYAEALAYYRIQARRALPDAT